jgi:hypothetical protein
VALIAKLWLCVDVAAFRLQQLWAARLVLHRSSLNASMIKVMATGTAPGYSDGRMHGYNSKEP